MMSAIGDVSSIQRDGDPPTVVTAGAAPGESGVELVQLRFRGGAHFHADCASTSFPSTSAGPITCRMAGKTLQHQRRGGRPCRISGRDRHGRRLRT